MRRLPPRRRATVPPYHDGSAGADVVEEGQRILSEQARIVRNQQDQAARILRVMLAVGGVMVTTTSILVTLILSTDAFNRDAGAGAAGNEAKNSLLEVGVDVIFTADPMNLQCNEGVLRCILASFGIVFIFIGVFLLALISFQIILAVESALKVLSPDDAVAHRNLDSVYGKGATLLTQIARAVDSSVSSLADRRVGRAVDRAVTRSVSKLENVASRLDFDVWKESESEDGTADDQEDSPDYFQIGPEHDTLQDVAEDVAPADAVPELVEGQSGSIESNKKLVKYNRKELGDVHQRLMDALEFLVVGGFCIAVGIILVLVGK